jgi:hypothetical protein
MWYDDYEKFPTSVLDARRGVPIVTREIANVITLVNSYNHEPPEIYPRSPLPCKSWQRKIRARSR